MKSPREFTMSELMFYSLVTWCIGLAVGASALAVHG